MKDWHKALKIIPGGNSLFSKRPFLYHSKWPTHFISAKNIQITDTNNCVYDDFYFIGPVPIDFDDELSAGYCVVDELCKINLKQLKRKGIRKKKK